MFILSYQCVLFHYRGIIALEEMIPGAPGISKAKDCHPDQFPDFDCSLR